MRLLYPRRTLLSWCLGIFAVGRGVPSMERRPRAAGPLPSTPATRAPTYRDLTAPVRLPAESIAAPWRSLRFSASVPRRTPEAGVASLEGILLRTGAPGVPAEQGGSVEAAEARPQSEVKAFCLLCPHEICHVEYRIDTSQVRLEAGVTPQHPLLVCPCHFSVFDPLSDGARISGPAYRGLFRFNAQVAQETVTITQIEEEVLTLFDAVSPPREER